MNPVTEKKIYKPPTTYSMSPSIVMVGLFIVSITMIFAALTSAFIFRKSEGTWLSIEIPTMFWVSGGIIVLSSIILEIAKKTFNTQKLNNLLIQIILVLILGVSFIITQWLGWIQLIEHNVYFVSTPSATFIYVLTGLHVFHLITAIIYLLIVMKKILNFINKKQINKASISQQLGVFSIYWHFLDGLWIYLLLFFAFNH